MSKPKISFEQVSLEVVKKILEDQAQEKKNGWPGAQDQEQEVSKDFSETRATNGGTRKLPQKTDPEKSNGKRQTLNDEELKFTEWQAPLQDLILEFDPKKLAEKIQRVETVIFERQQQLYQGSDGHAER